MSDNKHIEIMKKINEDIWNNAKVELIDNYYLEDFVAHTPSGKWIGCDGVKNAVLFTHNAFPDWHEKIEDIFTSENKLVLRYISTGTHKGYFNNIPPSNNKIVLPEISIFLFKSNKVIEQWDSFDMFSLYKQMGVYINI